MGLFEQLPYTNFHDLNLTELIKFVNQTIKTINEMATTIEEQNQAISDFKDYVMDYLNNLDVEQDVKDYIDELIANNTIDSLINKSWLNGKNIVWYGDSWGTTANNVISTFTSRYPNVNVTNRCIGGTMFTRTNITGFEYNSGYQRIMSDNDINDFDYIFIMYGVNDWAQSLPLKTKAPDEYEYLYCVENVIKYLKTTFPTCEPVFIFQSYCWQAFGSSDLNGINRAGINQAGYINNAIDLCENYGVKYINLFELSGVNRYNYTTYMRLDGSVYVHPKQILSDKLVEFIFNGDYNTGHCYGENWSDNVSRTIVNYSSINARSDYETLINNVPNYPRHIVPSNATNMIETPVKQSTVIHVQGYKDTSDLMGVFILTQDGNNPIVSTGITNITKVSYFDMYIEVDYHDKYSVQMHRAGARTETLYGYEVRFKDGYSSPVSFANAISVVSAVPATINTVVPTRIENGIQHFGGLILVATGNLNAFADILNCDFITYENSTVDIVGIDVSTGVTYPFYLYNGKLRSRKDIPSGSSISIIPCDIPVPQ